MTIRKFFGTDGIRGRANTEPMSPDVALRVGIAAGLLFVRGDHRHQVIIGKDTRLSGYMLEPALVAGFTSAGMDVLLVGPLPTPAIAMLTRSMRADLGVMISASHNPFEDNGIKLFGPDGFKLSDETEMEIERLMAADVTARLAAPMKLGRARRLEDAAGRYIESAKASFPRGLTLDGLRIVVDCANGAAYRVAPTVLAELGAEVISVGVNPDGFNINKDCGSTQPAQLCGEVLAHGADLGIALDGDADRVLLADERGQLIDGDQVLALIAQSWARDGRLKGEGIVATVMSNLGLERFLSNQKLALHRTAVGDRYVVERMRETGLNVGGEQSGHMILSDFATTGDGLVAALQVLATIMAEGRPASEVCRRFQPLPATPQERPLRRRKAAAGQPGARRHARHGNPPRQFRPPPPAPKRHRETHTRHGRSRGRGAGPARRQRDVRGHRTGLLARSGSGLTATIMDGLARNHSPRGRVLVVAGSDSGGGAGIQADLKTIAAFGGYGMTAITAVTAQDTNGVHGVAARSQPISSACRWSSRLADIGADALKTGMLGDAATVEAVAAVIASHKGTPFVLDPVMVAKGGHRLLTSEAIACIKRVLLPFATLITPNVPEAEALSGMEVHTEADLQHVAEALMTMGVGAVLLKGGHLDGPNVTDVLATEDGLELFVRPRIATRHTHGTGCTLASAIATGLAQGLLLPQAVSRARDYVQAAIAQAPGLGSGHGPLNHTPRLEGSPYMEALV